MLRIFSCTNLLIIWGFVFLNILSLPASNLVRDTHNREAFQVSMDTAVVFLTSVYVDNWDGSEISAYGKVVSGTLSVGDKYLMLGDDASNIHCTIKSIQNLQSNKSVSSQQARSDVFIVMTKEKGALNCNMAVLSPNDEMFSSYKQAYAIIQVFAKEPLLQEDIAVVNVPENVPAQAEVLDEQLEVKEVFDTTSVGLVPPIVEQPDPTPIMDTSVVQLEPPVQHEKIAKEETIPSAEPIDTVFMFEINQKPLLGKNMEMAMTEGKGLALESPEDNLLWFTINDALRGPSVVPEPVEGTSYVQNIENLSAMKPVTLSLFVSWTDSLGKPCTLGFYIYSNSKAFFTRNKSFTVRADKGFLYAYLNTGDKLFETSTIAELSITDLDLYHRTAKGTFSAILTGGYVGKINDEVVEIRKGKFEMKKAY